MADFLIVEDDIDLAHNLLEILNDFEHHAELAHSVEQAERSLKERKFDGVITDFRLPGACGVDLIQSLREQKNPVPVLMMSAYMEHSEIEQAKAAGALAVLPKPLDLQRLLTLLDAFVNAHREVLIVEDNEALAENMAEALRDHGIEVSISSSAEQALSRPSLPSVALVDLRLPDRSGLEVARRLWMRDPSIRLFVVTAHAEELRDKLIELSTVLDLDPERVVITKPFDLRQLIERVGTSLTGHGKSERS